MNPIFFAIAAAGSFGLWTVFHKLAAPYVNQVVGAIFVSLTAVVFGSAVLFLKARHVQWFTDEKGLIFIFLAGLSAFFIDFLALSAYSRGLPLTIGGPIIIGGSIAVAVMMGFVLGEPVTFVKSIGIVFILLVGGLLATLAK